MKNVDIKLTPEHILTLTIDLKKEFGSSKTGKSIIIASTEGNARIPGTETFIGLNIYKFPKRS